MNPDLKAKFDEERRFFSNRGKKEREKWVVDAWCRLSKRQNCSILQRERPDFTVGSEKVEIVEVLYPNRKRQKEVTEDAEAISEGRLPEPRDAGSLEEVKNRGHDWILKSVRDKAFKYQSIPTQDWILLLYVNFSFWERINWDLVQSEWAIDKPAFKEIHGLNPDGTVAIRLA